MRLHGYCTECHKIKRIVVAGHALATMVARGSQVPTGVCDDCKAPRETKR